VTLTGPSDSFDLPRAAAARIITQMIESRLRTDTQSHPERA
jgi:hypothetical protein